MSEIKDYVGLFRSAPRRALDGDDDPKPQPKRITSGTGGFTDAFLNSTPKGSAPQRWGNTADRLGWLQRRNYYPDAYERAMGRPMRTTNDYLSMLGFTPGQNTAPLSAEDIGAMWEQRYSGSGVTPAQEEAIQSLLYPDGVEGSRYEGDIYGSVDPNSEHGQMLKLAQDFKDAHGTDSLTAILDIYGVGNFNDLWDLAGVTDMQSFMDLVNSPEENTAYGWSGGYGGWGGGGWGSSGYKAPKWYNPMLNWVIGMREHGKVNRAGAAPQAPAAAATPAG